MRLKPGAKVVLTLVVLVLIIAGAYRLGWLQGLINVIAPEKRQVGTVSEDDFSFGKVSDKENEKKPADVPATSGAKLTRPIKVAIVLWGGYAGGIMANGGFKPNKQSLFTKDYGIEVEIVQIDDFQASRDAFRAGGDNGGVDIMWSTVDAYALEYNSLSALQPVCILQYDWSRGGDAIAVGPGIKSASDLKGKKISVAEATPSHFFLLYVLSQAGLSQNDVTPVFTASAIEAAQVFKAGKTDACVSWSPDVYMAARDRSGAKILTSTREATSLIADIFVARGDFVEKYPAETTAFIAGWLKGVDLANDDPDTAARLMANSFSGITVDDATGMLADVKLPSGSENRQFFKLSGSPIISYDDLFSAASNIWRKVGYIEQATRPDITRNTLFLDRATADVAAEPGPSPEEEFAFTQPTTQVTKQQPIVTKHLSIYFATGSATLDDNAKVVLEQAAEFAQTFGSAYIRVSGNTDNVGGRQMNLDLSQRRAKAVADFMINTYGFSRQKFIVVGNGPDKPVASNDTDEGRAKNRRTDFEVLPQEQAE